MLSQAKNDRLTRVGPGTPMGELMRRYWHPIAGSSQLTEDNPTKEVRLLGEDLVLFRSASGKGTRVENRLVGADMNPYLAMAASLASGLYGIEKGLTLGDPIQGNAYDAPAGTTPLPRSLAEAADRLDRSEAAREILGDVFVDHYVATRRWEVREFAKAITDWELKRYFEII